MRVNGWGIHHVQWGVVIGVVISACSTDLGGPDNPKLQAHDASPRFTESVSQLTIYENDGSSYTLSIPDREVRYSDGRILQLTEEQTVLMAANFHSVIGTDPVATDLQYLEIPPDPNCPDPGKVCGEDQRQVAPPDIQIRRLGPSDRPERRRGASGPSRARMYRDRTFQSPPLYSFAQWGGAQVDACTNVVNQAAYRRMEYLNRRTSLLRDIWGKAVVLGANFAIKVLPPGTIGGAFLVTEVYEAAAVHTNVNILAFVWNSYGCSTRAITAGPIWSTGGGGGGGGSGGYTCTYEHWSISFDNGATRQGIWVKVCEMMQ